MTNARRAEIEAALTECGGVITLPVEDVVDLLRGSKAHDIYARRLKRLEAERDHLRDAVAPAAIARAEKAEAQLAALDGADAAYVTGALRVERETLAKVTSAIKEMGAALNEAKDEAAALRRFTEAWGGLDPRAVILRAEKAEQRLADYAADAEKVLNEQCPSDEHHCSCVPHLRMEIDRLRRPCKPDPLAEAHAALAEATETAQRAMAEVKRLRHVESTASVIIAWCEGKSLYLGNSDVEVAVKKAVEEQAETAQQRGAQIAALRHTLSEAQAALEPSTCGEDCGCEGSNLACVAWQAIEDALADTDEVAAGFYSEAEIAAAVPETFGADVDDGTPSDLERLIAALKARRGAR
jgi:hypothetical protein